jgi:hypothetical protein
LRLFCAFVRNVVDARSNVMHGQLQTIEVGAELIELRT